MLPLINFGSHVLALVQGVFLLRTMVNCKSPSNHHPAEYVLLFPTTLSKFKKLKCLDHMNFRVSLFFKDIACWKLRAPVLKTPSLGVFPSVVVLVQKDDFFPDFDARTDWKQFECSPKNRAVFQSTFSSHTVGTPINDGDRCSTPEKTLQITPIVQYYSTHEG